MTTITTRSEMDNLPLGSILVDASGTAAQKLPGGWYQPGEDYPEHLGDGVVFPANVLHRGK